MSRNIDIRRVRREKSRLKRLEKIIPIWSTITNKDISAKEHIKNAIEELHMAELDLIKGDF